MDKNTKHQKVIDFAGTIPEISADILPEPFKTAYLNNHSIDYKVDTASKITDHEYVKKIGLTIKMNSDCSMTCSGLGSFTLSSYGDWGTFFTDWADDAEKKIFLDMVKKNIIQLWRIRAYKRENGITVAYDYTNGSWMKNGGESWKPSTSPFE